MLSVLVMLGNEEAPPNSGSQFPYLFKWEKKCELMFKIKKENMGLY